MLRLEFPNESHKAMWEEMIEEWNKYEDISQTSPGTLFQGENYCEFLEYIKNIKEGKVEGKTPATFLFLFNEERLLGGIDIRHHIEHPYLKEWGGHIGYGIRPSERKKGYASNMLALGLQEAKNIGISKALITCFDDNIASAKVIEKNGGIFERLTEKEGRFLRRYWIKL